MTVLLSEGIEAQLRELAGRQGRDVLALVEDALREYLEAGAITDLTPAEVADCQLALTGELGHLAAWEDEAA